MILARRTRRWSVRTARNRFVSLAQEKAIEVLVLSWLCISPKLHITFGVVIMILFSLTNAAFFGWAFKDKHVPKPRLCPTQRMRQPFIAWPRQRNGRSALIASIWWRESMVRVLCLVFFLLRLRFCSFGSKLRETLPQLFLLKKKKIGCKHMKCRCRQEFCHRCSGTWPCRKGCA